MAMYDNPPGFGVDSYLTGDPLSMALGIGTFGSGHGLGQDVGLGGMSPTGISGTGLGGSYGTGDFTGPFENIENTTDTTGYDITGTGTGLTPMDVDDPTDPRDTTIYESQPSIIVRPRPKVATTIYDLPPFYDPVTPIPTSPTRVTSESYTPTPDPPQISIPDLTNFSFPTLPGFSPLGGLPDMPTGGFYSVNSGPAGMYSPMPSGIPGKYLPDLVQALSGGPEVLNRVLSA